MKGFNLNKTGERVNELLSRQYIVPTLLQVPNESTLTWKDGDYIVHFRIGELCRVKINDKYTFYRLEDLVNSKAIWENIKSSEIPNMENYYTKDQIESKGYLTSIPDEYITSDELEQRLKDVEVNVDLNEYYTKEEVNAKFDNIEFPESENVKILTHEEYDILVEEDKISSNNIYFITSNGEPSFLYIGKVLIAQREEGQKGFTYNFPIIF